MFSKYLVEKFVPHGSGNARQKYGYLAGVVGIFANLLLFGIKFLIGFLLNSVAITADAFNNLSDLGSSLVTIVGFKIADKPADKDHPFGHGRGEYIAGLVVSFMVLLVGFEFVKSSVDRIFNPVRLAFDLWSFAILIVSILIKAWLGHFYGYINKKVSSGTLNATSFDSYSDVVVTSCVALSLLLSRFTAFPVDGYIGLVVSLLILYAGYNLVKGTISPLLGEAPSPELVKAIMEETMSYDGIIGVHDLIVHTYGAGKYMASIHAEIPSDIPVMHAHEIIDKAENQISKKLNILLVIHMDPVNINDTEINSTRLKIDKILKDFPEIISIHDFRIIGQESYKNLLFDIVLSNDVAPGKESIVKDSLIKAVRKEYPEFNLIVGVDRNYIHQ
jgi:cation diffusion facilitator family transporter